MRRTALAASSFIIAASLLAPASLGDVTGVSWRHVDNTVGNPESDGAWNALAGKQYTFDLFLLGDAGQRINGINMGNEAFPDAAPFALHTNGAVFNHPLGSDVRSPAFENIPGFTGIRYDTFVAMGSDVPGPTISFAGQVDLIADGAVDQSLRALWFTTDNAVLDANGEMRILRITVSYPSGQDPFGPPNFLGTIAGGPLSSLQVGLPGGVLVDLVIPNALSVTPPSPGGAALAGLAGLLGLRRRR